MKGIIQRPIVLIAVIAAAVVGAVVLLTGGDDGESEPAAGQAAAPAAPSESGGSAKQAEAADEKVKEAVAKQEEAAGVPEAGSEADSDTSSEDDTDLTRDEVREKVKAAVPLAERVQFAQLAASGVLQGFGYTSATTKVNKRDIVTVLIPPGSACTVELARIPEVKQKLFEVILFAKKIRLKVLGYAGLNGYVADNCKPLEVPSAPGQVLWSATGSGELKSSPQLNVTANRFTVAFANNGGSLEIYVTKGEQLIEPIIKSETRETGSRTFAGPGIFRVTVTGSGSWAAKVYDGA